MTNLGSSLLWKVVQDVPDIRRFLVEKRKLHSNKKVELFFASLQIRPHLPATCNKSSQQLSKEEESGLVIVPKNYFWEETAVTLTKLGTRSNSRQHSAGKFLKKTTGTSPELFLEEINWHHLCRCMNTSPHQKTLLLNCGKCRLVRKHITVPLLQHMQRSTLFKFLQQKIHEMWHFAICSLAIAFSGDCGTTSLLLS